MSGVDDIISYKRKPEEDYYGILGCDEHSSVSGLLFFNLLRCFCELFSFVSDDGGFLVADRADHGRIQGTRVAVPSGQERWRQGSRTEVSTVESKFCSAVVILFNRKGILFIDLELFYSTNSIK